MFDKKGKLLNYNYSSFQIKNSKIICLFEDLNPKDIKSFLDYLINNFDYKYCNNFLLKYEDDIYINIVKFNSKNLYFKYIKSIIDNNIYYLKLQYKKGILYYFKYKIQSHYIFENENYTHHQHLFSIIIDKDFKNKAFTNLNLVISKDEMSEEYKEKIFENLIMIINYFFLEYNSEIDKFYQLTEELLSDTNMTMLKSEALKTYYLI